MVRVGARGEGWWVREGKSGICVQAMRRFYMGGMLEIVWRARAFSVVDKCVTLFPYTKLCLFWSIMAWTDLAVIIVACTGTT